ncbi:MAG: hypothetical protein GY778_27425 [bacterium]|nr:hypothetical protein [bacterium]
MLILGVFAVAASGQSTPSVTSRAGDAYSPVAPVGLDELAEAIAQARAELRRLVGPGDVLDTLYLGWFDRPYRRATLACALKTVALLERESTLRARDNGALTDAQLAANITWLEDALLRAAQPPWRHGLRPNQYRVATSTLSASGQPMPSGDPIPPLFSFVDRATATRHDRRFGDFDLLACIGFRAFGKSGTRRVDPAEWKVLLQRANALGTVLVIDGPMPIDVAIDSPQSSTSALRLVPTPLAGFLQPVSSDPSAGATPVRAMIDPPGGASWAESLARRALYRGATRNSQALVMGWCGPRVDTSPGAAARQVALAMWVHALDGQRLGLLEGWRDLRDGRASPYPNLLIDPATAEQVAHTALDLMLFADEIAAFHRRRPVVVVVGPECAKPGADNAWTKSCTALFDALLARQIQFDVIPRHRLDTLTQNVPCAAILAPKDEALTPAARRSLARMQAAGTTRVYWEAAAQSPAAAIVPVERRLASIKPSGPLVVTRREAEPAPADDPVLVFRGSEGRLAVANPAASSQQVWITAPDGARAAALRDLLTGDTFTRPDEGIRLGAWQVRLLVPATDGRQP